MFNDLGTDVGSAGMLSNVGFAGREWDDDAQLYYNRARWYDSNTGRFIGVDPIEDGDNWYVYAGSDPVNYRDPTGLSATHPLDAFGGGFSGGSVAPAPTIVGGATPAPSITSFGSPSSFTATPNPALNSAINVLGSSSGSTTFSIPFSPTQSSLTSFDRQLSNDVARIDQQRFFADQSSDFRSQLALQSQLRTIATQNSQYTAPTLFDQVIDVASAGVGGLATGGKAIFNSVADTAANFVTLGFYDSPIRFTPTQTDIANGFGAASISSRIGTEIVTGILTGGASKLGKIGKGIFALDLGGNILSAERAAFDISNNGASVGNTLQLAGGLAGVAGNLPEISNFRFDTSTLSSGGLGGVQRKIPNPNGRRGNALTQAKTLEVIDNLESRGFIDIRTEVRFVPGTGGSGTNRFVDVVGVNPRTGQAEIIQIGRTNKSNSQIPVIRERRALDDLTFSPTLRDKFPNSEVRFVDVKRPGVIQDPE